MSDSVDPRTRAFAVERARLRSKTDRLIVGEPVLLDGELWWVYRDDGGRTLVVRSEDGRRAKEIARWQTMVAARLDPRAMEPDPPPGLPLSEPNLIDPDRDEVAVPQLPTPERTLEWLREIRDRFPGSPLEEWVALAESRNARIDAGRWPPPDRLDRP